MNEENIPNEDLEASSNNTFDLALRPKKLDDFIENEIINYNSKRNFDFGPKERKNVSCLSPYITHRLITEYETVERVLRKRPYQKVEKYV